MPTYYSDYTSYWNGTATDETVGNVTRARQGIIQFPPTPMTPQSVAGWEGASLDVGNPTVGGVEGVLWLKGTTSTTSSVAAVERELFADWAKLGARYNPMDGELELRIDNNNGSATSRVLECRVVELPCVKALTDAPGPAGSDYGVHSSSDAASLAYWYPVKLRADYGLWRKRTAPTGDFQTATTGGATLTTNDNDGFRATTRAKITIGTVVSATSVTIAASGHDTLTITTPTNGDVFDLGFAKRGQQNLTNDGNNTGTINAGAAIEIPVASTDWTVTTNAGTAVVTITYYPEYNTW